MSRLRSIVASAFVAVLVVVLVGAGAPRAFADGGTGKGSSSGSGSSGSGSGSSGSGSGSSGSGSSGSGSSGSGSSGSGSSGSSSSGSSGSGSSGSGASTFVPDNDDERPNTTIAEPRSSAAPTTSAAPVVAPPAPTVGPPGPGAPATQSPTTTKAPKQFVRTTACGSKSFRVEVRAESANLRVRTTIDRSKETWRAVVMQDRRVAWSGSARHGRIDRSLVDLPGPETLTVRLTNTGGVVCAADLSLPA